MERWVDGAVSVVMFSSGVLSSSSGSNDNTCWTASSAGF